jgi:hypothetical protein
MRDNRAFQGVDPATHLVRRADAAAHAQIHAGSSRLEMTARVNTPGEPKMTGVYMV